MIVGDKAAASSQPGGSSAVTECLRLQSQTPVLAISSKHPLLNAYLPAIPEEPVAELLRSLSRSFGAQGLPSYPSTGDARPAQPAFTMA